MNRQRLIELKVYRKRAKAKKSKTKTNLTRNTKKKGKKEGKRSRTLAPKIISIPPVFSLTANKDQVLKFFHSFGSLNKKLTKNVFFDFSDVKDISHGAITILLSYIGWLNDQGISIAGNYPTNRDMRMYFQRSGFLEFFRTIGKRDYEKGLNTIVAKGEDKTNPVLTAKLIRESTKTIWDFNGKNMKVQGMLIEMMANTINHAYIGDRNQKGWYFSIDHIPDENRVKFCFVDNGAGMLKTLRTKFPDKVAGFLGNKKTNSVIERAFEGEFGSRTKLSNRGRGLKAIKKVFEDGYIKSLKIITNNVFYDFDSESTENLNEYFEGTFYFWEIDKTCKR